MVKVIWQQAESPPHMGGSVVFARWHRCACAPHLCMLPWAPTSNPKRHLDRFRRFCTVHSRESLYFTTGCPVPPQNCRFSWGDLDPHLIHGSLGPPKSTTQTASRSVQPFSHRGPQSVPRLYNGTPPQNCPWIWTAIQYMVPWAHPSPQPKRHLDRCRRFCRAH